MSTFERLALCLAATVWAADQTCQAEANFGLPAAADEAAAWDISIPPDGRGLPSGSGTVKHGAAVYAAKCVSCHGDKGAGKPADTLAGGIGSLASQTPLKTVGSYWPYATTLFDYVRRAMPYDRPLSLSSDEVYALCAYILFLNGIVPEDATMDAASLPRVQMPNRYGFVDYSQRR
jgi:S-disulfanyl-L-cysteine oxidoreductase SoxD